MKGYFGCSEGSEERWISKRTLSLGLPLINHLGTGSHLETRASFVFLRVADWVPASLVGLLEDVIKSSWA